MQLLNLMARPLGGGGQIWWEDEKDGSRYRIDLATVRVDGRSQIAKPYQPAFGPPQIGSHRHGQWVFKLPPVGHPKDRYGRYRNPIAMDATNKRWAPIVAEAIRQVEEGDMMAKAMIADERAEQERMAKQKKDRADAIRAGLIKWSEELNCSWRPKARFIGEFASDDDLIALAIAIRA